MAKKKKTENVANTNVDLPEVVTSDFVRVGDEPNEVTGVITTNASEDNVMYLNPLPYNTIDNLLMTELMAYEEGCKMICTHYDREMKLNELEKRNYTHEQIKYNREQYSKFVNIHRKIREVIENKIENLASHENW